MPLTHAATLHIYFTLRARGFKPAVAYRAAIYWHLPASTYRHIVGDIIR